MFKETSLLLEVIVGGFPQERVLRKGKHTVFQRTRCVSALPYFKNTLCFSCFYIISCGRYGRTRHNNVRCFCLSSYHTMSSPNRAKETCGCWGKKDTEDFRHYVDEGFIDIDNCAAGYIESVRVDPRCRRFATPSPLIFV